MPKSKDETELDELLSDMLLELQSTGNQNSSATKQSVENQANQADQRTGEQMLESNQTQKQLCGGGRLPANLVNDDDEQQATSPRFLKKPSYDGTTSNLSSSAPVGQPFSYGIQTASPALQRRRLHSEKTAYVSESDPNEQSNRSPADRRSEENLIELLKQEATDDARLNNSGSRQFSTNSSIVSDGSVIAGREDLGWLERQKLKLKSRKEGDLWRDRFNKERSLMQELRTAVKPKQQEYDQPLHIDTNQSINIPINRASDSPAYSRYQRSQSAYEADNPELKTVNTKKKTLQRGVSGAAAAESNAPIRSQSPASINRSQQAFRKEPVYATNLPIKEEIIEEVKPKQSVYGTITRTPVVHNIKVNHIKVDRSNAPAKQTIDETDLNELIRTASSPIYAYSRPTSRQSTHSTVDNNQPVYRAQPNQVYTTYNQSTPIRVGFPSSSLSSCSKLFSYH